MNVYGSLHSSWLACPCQRNGATASYQASEGDRSERAGTTTLAWNAGTTTQQWNRVFLARESSLAGLLWPQGHIKACRASPEYLAFLAEFRRFVADVVVPVVDGELPA